MRSVWTSHVGLSRAVLLILVTALEAGHHMGMTEASAPRNARARVRAELTSEILGVARKHLAEGGAVNLSLRAVARDLGMVSSALYRYFPSRDDLLTALIVDAYAAVADVGEAADRACKRTDLLGRWLAVCKAVRAWALANPHEYALIYGTPVPGYVAPDATIEPVVRFSTVLVGILVEAHAAGRLAESALPLSKNVVRSIGSLRAQVPVEVPDAALINGVIGWTHLFGAISSELFGHRHNVVDSHEVFFDYEMRQLAALILR
jgi:AcrR family transcriptional regulator